MWVAMLSYRRTNDLCVANGSCTALIPFCVEIEMINLSYLSGIISFNGWKWNSPIGRFFVLFFPKRWTLGWLCNVKELYDFSLNENTLWFS